MTPDERAKRAAAAMWAADKASPWVGIEQVAIGEGTATMGLTVMPHHCNGHGICHGGIIYTLSDTAFAFACNSRNQSSVAHHNSISYLAPGQIGDRLTALATEISLAGRTGIYDVTVKNQDGRVIAEFRGISRIIRGQLFQEDTGETP
jgi:acyl-CoA thioesterase